MKTSIKIRWSSPAWLVFIAGVATSLVAFAVASTRVEQAALSEARAHMDYAVSAIQLRVERSFDVLLSTQALFKASGRITPEAFRQYISNLNLAERHPSIRSVSYAEYISSERKAAFEKRLNADASRQAAGYPPFAIKPPGTRDAYLPVMLYESVKQSSADTSPLGLDLIVDMRRESSERARDLGVPIMSGRIFLTSGPKNEPAFTVRLALYNPEMPTGTVEQRQEAFSGVLSVVFLARDFVADIISQPGLAAMSVSLHDRFEIAGASAFGAQTTDYLLYEKPALSKINAAAQDYFAFNIPIVTGGRTWQMHFAGRTSDFKTSNDQWLPWIVLVGGIITSILLALLIRSLASARVRAQKLADSITQDLRASESRLAEAQRLTQSMLEALPNPIFFKDTNGRYRGVNRAWEAFFGIPRSGFVGKTVFELYPHDKPVAERLDNMDQVLWKNPGTQVYDTVISKPDGQRHDVVYYKATYTGGDGMVAGIIGTIVDMTDRKQAERRQAMEHAVTRVLAESESLAEDMPRIIQAICATFGFECGTRYEYDREADLLRAREAWGIDTPEIQEFIHCTRTRVFKPSEQSGLIGRTFAGVQPVWIRDAAQEDGFKRAPLAARAGLHGAFAVPLKRGNDVLGVLEFFNTQPLDPDPMILQIVDTIGSQIGQYLVRMEAEEAVKFVAMHDSLTGLPNRVMFNQRLEAAISTAGRHSRKLAVMFIDLDRFKVINDTLGHESGDLLLREVAQRLRDSLRAGDTVSRLGGDEFVVLLEDIAPLDLGTVAQKLINSLTPNYMISGREVHITASLGISTYPTDATDLRSIMRYADIAMYRAKDQGRNTYQFFSSHMNEHAVERLTLESQLRRALEREELVLHYQPIVDGKTGHVTGMEALVRWQHPEAGIVPPAKFIGLAEETGLIVPIGEWVLDTACKQMREWHKLDVPPVKVAVNLSPRQFMHRDLVQDIVRVVGRTQCSAAHLELEITEGTVMHNAARTVALLGQLKEMGIRLAVDDFGTGYSSLAYLKRFPIDSLKIDRSFVMDIPADSGNRAIVQAIIAMAHSLGLRVIAEGVETPAQRDFLRAHRCDEMQGYFFAKPMPANDATQALLQSFATPASTKVMPLKPRIAR